MSSSFGGSYAPNPIPAPVVEPGAFTFAAVGLDHGHIYGMSNGLLGAGATLKWVYDPDPAKVAAFAEKFPQVKVASSEDEVLDDAEVGLVAGAAVTAERCALGLRVMDAGKDYFTDKAPLTTLEQLAAAREAVARTGRKYGVYYSERIHVETAVFASQLIEAGAIGRVVQVIGLGSHQIEQILHYTGSADGTVVSSQIANYANPEHPGLDDFGDATIVTDTGAR